MSLLKNGLNQEFYMWIDDVRRAFRKKEELEIELKEFERRLNGYNAVSYDLIGEKSSSTCKESKLLSLLSKIEEINLKKFQYQKLIKEYFYLIERLDNDDISIIHPDLLNYKVSPYYSIERVSKNKRRLVINRFARIYSLYKNSL